MQKFRFVAFSLLILLALLIAFSIYVLIESRSIPDYGGALVQLFGIVILIISGLFLISPIISVFAKFNLSESTRRALYVVNIIELLATFLVSAWAITEFILIERSANMDKFHYVENHHKVTTIDTTTLHDQIAELCISKYSKKPFYFECNSENNKCFTILISHPGQKEYELFGKEIKIKYVYFATSDTVFKTISATFIKDSLQWSICYEEYREEYTNSESQAKTKAINDFTKTWSYYRKYAKNKNPKFWEKWIFGE